MRWSLVLAACAVASASPVRADPDDAAVVAAARRWETPRRVCAAMARAEHAPKLDVRRCARGSRTVRLRWQPSAGAGERYAEATIGDESFYVIRVVVDARGKVTSVESTYSQGGY
ncbi:MAG TPA: hypothetical protein VHE35_13285 [Kofleriaceae bacterium]|nr:hypothetical protein [Kofleriaceae bacterium]